MKFQTSKKEDGKNEADGQNGTGTFSRGKLRLICGKDFWHTDDLGGKIPQITVADGPSGLRIVKERAEDGSETAYPAAAYPAISLLANTWNRAAAAEMGECLADECLEKDVDILLAPA